LLENGSKNPPQTFEPAITKTTRRNFRQHTEYTIQYINKVMPIINADIQKALRQVGISKSERDIPLTERLEANDLSLDNAWNVFLNYAGWRHKPETPGSRYYT